MQQPLLYAPIGGLGDVDLVFGRAGEGMGAGELLEVAPRAADHAKHLAVERKLKDPPRKCGFAQEHHLVWTRRNAQRIGRPDYLGEAIARRRVTVDRLGAGRRRHIDREHAQELAVGVEYLDAVVRAVAHIDVVVAVDRDGVNGAELPGSGARLAPRLHPVAVLAVLGHPRIDVAVADVDVALRVPGDVRGLTEHAVDRRKWQRHMLPGLAFRVRRLPAAAHHPDHTTGRVEPYHHTRSPID